MQLNCLTLGTPLTLIGLGKKVRQFEIVQIRTVYDLRDTLDGLKCWRMGFISCGKYLLIVTRIQVSESGPI